MNYNKGVLEHVLQNVSSDFPPSVNNCWHFFYVYQKIWLEQKIPSFLPSFLPLGTTAKGELWPPAQSTSILLYFPRLTVWFLNNLVFMVWGCYPHAQPPAWRTRVSLFVWLLLLHLSGRGDPSSSYATAGIALRVSGALKPHHHDKVETPSVGWTEDYHNKGNLD
jgi:hypothetical protein